ncbi:VWA domain-containing protein, partial [Escherichia coli]|nr:VWA domain-containing protein [Escherichia coli]
MINQDYNGGGTNISGALRQAFEDILKAKDEIAKAEIIIVTDGEDSFSDADVNWFIDTMKKNKIVVNVMDVNP